MSNRASDLHTAREIAECVLDLLVVIWAAAIVLALPGCSEVHEAAETSERVYVHLCEEMSEGDQRTWGFAAGDINAEYEQPVLFVGHQPTSNCGVTICEGERAAINVGVCETRLTYPAGLAAELASYMLRDLVCQ